MTFCSGLYNLGAVLGPVTGGFIADRLGLRTVYLIAAVIFVISTLIILFASKNPEPHHADQESSNNMGLLKNSRFLMFLGITLVTMFALYLPQPFTPNFLQNQQGFSLTTIGLFGGNAFATLALGSLRPIVGFLVGQAWVLLFSIIYLSADLPFWFGFGYFFIGGYRLCRSMVLAIARTLVHPRQTGLAYGMVETMNAIAIVVAPVLAGILYRRNPYLNYSVSIGLISAVILLNLFILVQSKRKNNHELTS